MTVALARSLKRFAVAVCLGWPVATLAAPVITVTVTGAALQPGVHNLPTNSRLRDAAIAAQVSDRAWFLGAALLRDSAISPQQRLKAGILFDLSTNRVHWLAENQPEAVALADRMTAMVQAMPVTGRVPAQLDPLQQLAIVRNDLLEDGDTIHYPLRASQVRVTGAVERDCVLAFDPAWQATDYVQACPRHALADSSYADVIQPDGVSQRRGVAVWNREAAPVAVGAVLYVPIATRHLAAHAKELNEDYVALLGTQVCSAGQTLGVQRHGGEHE